MKAIRIVLSSLLMLLGFALGAQAQISLNKHDATVKSCMEELQKEYGYSFVVPTDAVDISRSVTLNFSNASIEEVLPKLFEGQNNVLWNVDGKIVTLSLKKQPSAVAAAAPQDGKSYFIGKVVDENGEPMIGVAVEDISSDRGGIVGR